MCRPAFLLIAVALGFAASACGTSDSAGSARLATAEQVAATPSVPTPIVAAAPPAATPTATVGATPEPAAATATPAATTRTEVSDMAPSPTANPASGDQALSLQQTEGLAKADLAARLQIQADQIQVVASSSRTWPDDSLGCAARRGFYEAKQVPGYAITLSHDGATYTYHTDQRGRLIRCTDAGKPLGPISR